MVDANGASTRLAPEIWIQIFEEVARADEEAVEWQEADEDYLNLKSLSLSCRHFYELAAPIVHHTINLNGANDYGQSLLNFLADVQDNAVTRNLRTIVVQQHYEIPIFVPEHESLAIHNHLVELLDRLRGKANLKDLRWELRNEIIPSRLLDRLHNYWPLCRIHVKANSWFMAQMPKEENAVHRIHGSPSLVSLDYSWSSRCDAILPSRDDSLFDSDIEDESDMPTEPLSVKTLVDSCRGSLETLVLRIRAGTSRSKYVETFTLEPKDRLPALKSLELNAICLAPGQGRLWSQCTDWSSLIRLVLDIDGPHEFITHFTGRVPNLSFFEIRVKSPNDEQTVVDPLDAFIKQIKHLQQFVSYNVPKSILPTLAAYHGAFLKTLKFRVLVPTMASYGSIEDDDETPFRRLCMGNIVDEEENPGPEYRYAPSSESLICLSERKNYVGEMDRHLHHEDMHYIQQAFPYICSFAFDLDPRGCLTYDLLTPISRHQNLQHVEIHLPLNARDDISHYEKEMAIHDAIKRALNYIIDGRMGATMMAGSSPDSRRQVQFKSLSIANEHWDWLDSPYITRGMKRMYRCRRMENGEFGEVVHYPVERPYHGSLSGKAIFGD